MADGEQEFVVFAAVQGGGDGAKVEFSGGEVGLLVDGQIFLKHHRPNARRFAELQQIGSQSVRKVDHGGGRDARLGQFVDDVHSGFGFELPLHHVIVPFQLWLHIRISQENLLFAFQNLQAQVSRTQITRNAEQVVGLGGVAVNDFVLRHFAKHAHRNEQSRAR